MNSSDETSIAASVNDLRRVTEVGFAKVEGQLDLLNEKVERIKEDNKKNAVKVEVIEGGYVTRKSFYTVLGLMISVVTVLLGIFIQVRSGQ